ncbi:hypothetical protein PMAYCL1PPCAC_07769, partial [Pristionchus mayeri]
QSDLRSLYVNDEILNDKDKLMRTIANLVSDYYMNAGTLELCRKTVAKQDEPAFLYVVDHYCSKAMGLMDRMLPIKDTTHACELVNLFKRSSFTANPTLDDGEKALVDTFTTALTNFAKFGNPNGGDQSKTDLPSEWIPLDETNCGRNFVFNTTGSHMTEEFFEGRPAKYIEIMNKHQSS